MPPFSGKNVVKRYQLGSEVDNSFTSQAQLKEIFVFHRTPGPPFLFIPALFAGCYGRGMMLTTNLQLSPIQNELNYTPTPPYAFIGFTGTTCISFYLIRYNYIRWPATSWVHYTTSCNTQSSAPEDGQNNFPKHVELIGIINKPLLLHLVGCLYYLQFIIFF